MNAVIPHPLEPTTTPVGDPGASGPPVAGPWRVHTSDSRLTAVAATVRALLAPHLGDRLVPAGAEPPGAHDLVLTLDDAPPAPRLPLGVCPHGAAEPTSEAYRLTVTADGVLCRAGTPEGVFRGATTAAQLIVTAAAAGRPRLAAEEFVDAPRHAWRGLLVDPARAFLTPDELRRLVDLAALYKLNVLHLHLTDNEGWRLNLPGTPALTPAGSDFYTVEDYRGLQEYAAERFVTVVPEIDLPGHCAALRRALPGLPPAPAPPGLPERFAYVPPLDLADPATRSTVGDIVADVCRQTSGPFVHVGGDEAVGITPDGFALAVRELRAAVRRFGKRPLAWQESSRAGVTPDDIVQWWVDVEMMDLPDTEEELAARPDLLAAGLSLDVATALKRFFAPTDHDLDRVLAGGGRVLLSPQSHLYLDRGYASGVVPADQAEAADRLGFPNYRPRTVQHAAAWDPAAHQVPDAQVAGVEAAVFGESLSGLDDLSTLLLPRLASVAEAAWTGRPPRWEEYRERLGHHGRLWRDRRLPYLASTEVPWR